jgi:hypothetical protein
MCKCGVHFLGVAVRNATSSDTYELTLNTSDTCTVVGQYSPHSYPPPRDKVENLRKMCICAFAPNIRISGVKSHRKRCNVRLGIIVHMRFAPFVWYFMYI